MAHILYVRENWEILVNWVYVLGLEYPKPKTIGQNLLTFLSRKKGYILYLIALWRYFRRQELE